MRPEVKEKWIEKLESGEFKQGKYVLKKQHDEGDVRHCCLGILCEIYAEETGAKWEPDLSIGRQVEEEESDYRPVITYSLHECPSVLPVAVSEWAGLDDSNPSIPFGKVLEVAGADDPGLILIDARPRLSYLNDRMDLSFEQIARLIREVL